MAVAESFLSVVNVGFAAIAIVQARSARHDAFDSDSLVFSPKAVTKCRCSFPDGGIKVPRKSKRRAWSATDLRTLKTMAANKKQAASIARKLKRTEGATRQKAFTMGLSLDSRA
jgi:hypothetical protein